MHEFLADHIEKALIGDAQLRDDRQRQKRKSAERRGQRTAERFGGRVDVFELPTNVIGGRGGNEAGDGERQTRLHRAIPEAPSGHPVMQGTILERTYLGESWDYVVRPTESALRLRVAAPPLDVHDVGSAVWLALDPSQLAVVQ